MRRFAVTTLVTASLVAGFVASAEAESMPYKVGPSNGDASTYVDADPAAGVITILQHNTRQAGTVHCSGQGPRATLAAEHVVEDKVSAVSVAYADAVMTDSPVIDVLVTGKKDRVLGHKATFGPKYYESGTVNVPLFTTPAIGETLRILIGMQAHAGCLPHPFVLGLPGSRPLEGGRASFPSVTVS